MKKIDLKLCFLLIMMAIGTRLNAQLDSIGKGKLFKKHLSFGDTFFGNEDQYQVCYPKDHRTYFYVIILVSIATVLFGLLVIYIKNSSNKKLKEKNAIIAEQNKDLIDSINYSLRIQQTILPDKITEAHALKNGFVLYKPKNIVSGDFYWLHEQGHLLYMAIIDCTGHGVPGALLTMLAYNAINKAVLEKEITDPTLILDSMNTDIKIALKQDKHNPIQDSMEVAIVSLNTITNQLIFSGANLSLTYIKDGELKIINGGKCSVGSVQDSAIELPKTHIINLNSGDSFYLYTDGYADQFGGEKGKKFKYKQLEQLLLDNYSKPPNEQYSVLNSSLTQWRGNLEQVDDVTIIGMNI